MQQFRRFFFPGELFFGNLALDNRRFSGWRNPLLPHHLLEPLGYILGRERLIRRGLENWLVRHHFQWRLLCSDPYIAQPNGQLLICAPWSHVFFIGGLGGDHFCCLCSHNHTGAWHTRRSEVKLVGDGIQLWNEHIFERQR